MNDPYIRLERIAIRMDSHMTEAQAIALTDAKKPAPTLTDRIAAMAADQAMRPKRYNFMPKHRDTAILAAGDNA